MDQRAMVARSHGSYSIALGSSLHPHYPPQQSQPQAQQPQVQQLQQQQQQVHQGQQPPSVPQQQRPPAPINVQSPTRTFYQPSQDGQDALEESLKRTVKIVYWYKAGHEPIRLHQEISSYPFVRLSMFTHLVADLGLSAASLVDAYDPEYHTWGQQHIMTVQTVKTVPRLLFRARKSLLEGLADHDCPGLDHELRLQHTPPEPAASPTRPPKRSAPDAPPDGPNKHLRTSSAGYTPTFAASIPAPAHAGPSSSSTLAHPAPASPFLPASAPPVPSPTTPPSTTLPAPSSTSPNPPLKRWPNDYAVCEIAAGFRAMDALVRASPALTQRAAFEQVFGCRYVKSTVCRHRGVWKRAAGALKDAFERMGPVEGALWGEFVKKTDFRRETPRVKAQGEDGMEGGMGYVMGLGMLEEQRPPMASLVPPSA